MMAHDQNTERLIKEISAQKSSNIAVVFHTCRGETCPPYSQWIRRSLQSTLLTPEHGRLLTCAPLRCLRGTGFTPFTDLIFTIFFLFFFTHWQTKMMGDVLLTGSLCDRMSPPFFPSVSSSSPTAFSFVADGLELSRPPRSYGQQSTDAQLSCPGTTKDQLPAPWQLKLFWETRIRTDHEFRRKSSNQRNLGKRACKDTAFVQLLFLDPKIQSGIVLFFELHAHYVSTAQQRVQS